MKFESFIKNDQLKTQISKIRGSLSSLFSLPDDKKMMSKGRLQGAHDSTIAMLQDERLSRWLQRHGINPPKSVPPYKDGGAGRAYFIDRFVLKFTNDVIEGNIATMASQDQNLPSTIISVLPIDNSYAILQNKVLMGEEIDKRYRDAADYLTAVIDDHPEMQGFPSNEADRKSLCLNALQEYNGNTELVPYMLLVMEALDKLYQSTGYHHDDAGPSNIGIDSSGNVVTPDMGPNRTSDFSTEKSLDRIKSNREKLGLPHWNRV